MHKSLKTLAAAVVLAVNAATAYAVDLVVTNTVASGVTPPPGSFSVMVPGFSATNGTIGTLEINGAGTVTYTYLGREAGNTNNFFNTGGTVPTILGSMAVGTSSTQSYAGASVLSFSFNTTAPAGNVSTVTNGSAAAASPTFAIFAGTGTAYKYILGFDDKVPGTADRDFDDFVIGVTAVPEPEAYGLALAGMGVVAFAMRRRKAVKAA